jgi:ferredoxin
MRYERYHIPTTPAPPRHSVIGKFKVIRDTELCRSCGRCIKACVYNVHERETHDDRAMAEPLSYLCRNCFRCMQTCPTHALTMTMNPEYSALGDDYWEPHRFYAISYEAENGRIPVYGAGYRGPFGGKWFDGMWTDMSEIVRPTRDGIHGREYISTSVDLGRRPSVLQFDAGGRVLTEPTKVLEIQLPIIFDMPPDHQMTAHTISIISKSAALLGTLCVVPAKDSLTIPTEERPHVVPLVRDRIDEADSEALRSANIIEIAMSDRFEPLLRQARETNRKALIAARVSLRPGDLDDIVSLCKSKVDVAHVCADNKGMEQSGQNRRHLRYALREIHTTLVERSMRDDISIIVSGGIAAAEHVPKAILLGADAVAVSKAAMIALECRLCEPCTSPKKCPVELQQADHGWAVQRVANMIGAWRDQLLEVMGAMGIREVRRLRGELGRAMFAEDLEGEIFAPMFKGAQK